MPIDLPPVPRTASLSPRLVSFGADLQPPLGGPTQRVRRLGSRFAVQVQLPTLGGPCAGKWIAALLRAEAEGDTLRLTLPQIVGVQANATVSGAGWAGTQMGVAALGAGHAAGAFFSFTAGGRNYLHQLTADAAAGDTGLRFAPLLRTSPANGAALNFAAPVIEGYADPGPIGWDVQFKRYGALSFTLTENR